MTRFSRFSIVTLALTSATLAGCQEDRRTPAPSQPVAVPPASAAAVTVNAGSPPAAAGRTQAELVSLGEHLVKTSGCHDCHTPLKMGANGPEPDMSRMLSGHPQAMKLPPAPVAAPPWIGAVAATNTAWSGPWGVSFTANLTPDKATGLGSWSKETFIQTIRTGRHMGRGRPILPPMPVPAYQNFSDEELAAVFAYLQTIPAIDNQVPTPLPPPNAPKPRG